MPRFHRAHFDETWGVAFFRNDQYPLRVSAHDRDLRVGWDVAQDTKLRPGPGAKFGVFRGHIRPSLFVEIGKGPESGRLFFVFARFLKRC